MKIVTIVGARPQFIKAAAVSRVLRSRDDCHECLVHTGQHYDAAMSDVFFEQLAIPQPDHHLDVGSGSHGEQTGKMLARIEAILVEERPDWCLVYGDTNSTLAGALAAAKLHIPVAHVEAGLRSFNRRMPEEVNRIVTDHVSALLLAPTKTAMENLRREGIDEPWIHLVGDVMHDAFCYNAKLAENQSRVLEELGLEPERYVLATVHRAENADNSANLAGILEALIRLVRSGTTVVFPVHPRTRARLDKETGLPTVASSGAASAGPRMMLIDPVDYLSMLRLEKHASVILTDSGGVQKEAYWAGVPCVTLRRETEWVETLENGWNTLVGSDPERIVRAVRAAPERRKRPRRQTRASAAEAIADILGSVSAASSARGVRPAPYAA